MDKTIRKIIFTGIIAALYAALTLILAPISYGPVQFRFSEILVLLAYFNPLYIGGLTLGCFIANLLGPNGLVDVVFGTLATFISVYAIYISSKIKMKDQYKLFIASIWPTVVNGVIIGLMLSYVLNIPFIIAMAEVAVGEFVVVTIIGVPLIYKLRDKIRGMNI
ncbi:QueT transporter family protein [Clostridium sardiniense]|uniref:QueT transporter family protein n=1 Tax=Clostridium sardiniense TaxID=29369 RepID=A0ABS7KXU5_CLOSR|nr:QueT transporter family protein [Clostridium sardiniense]MBY0755630.1 QueT transporter family protein [Clostridium sardiniense]MDQ0461800.1 putative membrane protein [Clostridium sardiniense]